MTKKTTIANVDKVSLPGESKSPGKSFDPSTSTQPTSDDQQLPNTKKEQAEAKKKGPGRRTLSPEDKLSDDLVNRIDDMVKTAASGGGAPWNIGGIPPRPGQDGSGSPAQGQGNVPSIGTPTAPPPGKDERIWVDIDELSRMVDKLNKEGESNERVADAESKEEMTDSEKSMGGKGKGKGPIRNRIAIENLSKTDWAGIFKTRLKGYSNEKSKYLPWDRRLASDKILGRSIGSRVQKKDVLPELNLLVDTSSSLSYHEMSVILGEIESALESSKIKILNVFLWATEPYAFNTFKDVSKKNYKMVEKWIQDNWHGGGNDEVKLYDEIIKRGKAKKFTISLTDAYLGDHMIDGPIKKSWTKALDPQNLIFAICYPNMKISLSDWERLGARMPGTKVPIFLNKIK